MALRRSVYADNAPFLQRYEAIHGFKTSRITSAYDSSVM